ncbi:MAG: hypothetical protein ACYDA0_02830 [Candidatus Dormibacteraceae bacterium]
MRPGRASDLPALVELWRSEVRSWHRDSVPREPAVEGLLANFDWAARSRVEEGPAGLAGAVLVTSRPTPEGTVARVDPAAARGPETARLMRELVQWGLNLSRAAGAAAAQVWVGPGQDAVLQDLGLAMVRPWWRMDRSLHGDLPAPAPVDGYELHDGSSVARDPGPRCTTARSPTTGAFHQEPRRS